MQSIARLAPKGAFRVAAGCFGLLFFGRLCAMDSGADGLPHATPQDLGFSSERIEYIDRFYQEKVSKGEMAGMVLLIARHGKVCHFSAIGYADIEKKKPMATDTIFRIYSMTKPVAAVALMLLYQEGKFQLNEPVAKYLPEFASLRVLRTPESAVDDTVALAHPPTIQDLLRHTAGFSHGMEKTLGDAAMRAAGYFDLERSLADMAAILAKVPLRYQPGTIYSYSAAADIEARLVEILSGVPFDEFLSRRLFEPLQMKDTAYWFGPDRAARVATVYWSKHDQLLPIDDAHGGPPGGDINITTLPWSVNSYHFPHKRTGGSFGLASTASDYWRFAQMMANGGELGGVRVLMPRVVDFMRRDHLNGIPFPDAHIANGIGWGLGFAVMKDPAAAGFMSSPGTFYWAGAASTHFWIDPAEDLVVVAMTQHMGAAGVEQLWPQLRTLVYSALLK